MLKKILIGILVVVVVFLILVAIQPADFHMVRSATMSAPPEKVFNQVNDFHAWDAWSPWAKLDPNMKVEFKGPETGKDAFYKWTGNDEVGEGQMTIVESQPPELIRIKLEFLKPMEATNDTQFTFKPQGEQTQVTWSMSGTNNFMGKMFCLFVNMDTMIGADFEKGLASMKAIVEASEAPGNQETSPPATDVQETSK